MLNINDDLKRIKSAVGLWELWRSIHEEAQAFSCPNRETFNRHSPGQRKNRQVYDSTAVIGLQQFSNRIQSSLMPPWVNWLDFVSGDEIPEQERASIDKQLEKITDKFFSVINHSNFYTEIAPALIDLGIGTGAIAIEENPLGYNVPIRFVNIPLAELYIEKPAGGAIENVWRKQKVKPEHIKQLWPMANLTEKLEKMAQKPDAEEICVWNGQVHDPETGTYKHKVIYEQEKHCIFEQTFKEKRIIVFRWHVTPGEVYGRGPIIQMLPDIRTANIMMEYILKNAALQMTGVYTGVNDGIFNPNTTKIMPGSIIPVGSNASTNPSLIPMTPSGNIGLGFDLLSSIRDNIKKSLFADPLGDITDPTKTATEMMIRQQEMLKNSGASFGRLKTELIEQVTVSVVSILKRLGELPDMTIDGKEVAIRMQSPLAKSEQLEDFQNTQVWMQNLTQFIPMEAIAGSVKIEELPRITQEQLGVSSELIRTPAEREELAQQVQAAAQQGLEGGI